MKDKKLWLNIATKLFLLPLIEEENSLKWLNKTTLGIYVADTNKPEWENKIIPATSTSEIAKHFPTKKTRIAIPKW